MQVGSRRYAGPGVRPEHPVGPEGEGEQCDVVLDRRQADNPHPASARGRTLRPVVGGFAVAGLIADHRIGDLVGERGVRVGPPQRSLDDLSRRPAVRGQREQLHDPTVAAGEGGRHPGVTGGDRIGGSLRGIGHRKLAARRGEPRQRHHRSSGRRFAAFRRAHEVGNPRRQHDRDRAECHRHRGDADPPAPQQPIQPGPSHGRRAIGLRANGIPGIGLLARRRPGTRGHVETLRALTPAVPTRRARGRPTGDPAGRAEGHVGHHHLAVHTQQRPTLVDGIVGLVQQGQLQCQAQREKHRHRHQHMHADHPGLGQPDHVDGPHRGVNHECGSGEEGEGRAHPTGVILGVVGPRVTKPQQDADDAARGRGGDRNGHPAQDGFHQETPQWPGVGE